MAAIAQTLPVRSIPEQSPVLAMRRDVIQLRRRNRKRTMPLEDVPAQRMLPEVTRTRRLPPRRVVPLRTLQLLPRSRPPSIDTILRPASIAVPTTLD